jgi:hypothetical protein
LAGGEFNPEPIRFGFAPASLSLTGASISIGPSLSSSIAGDLAAVLDTLFASEAIVDDQGRPTRRFQQLWENAIGGLKDALTSTSLSIAELQRIYAGINAAQSTATEAVQQANDTAREKALNDSYVSPLSVLTASSSGTVTVAAHTRIYGDGTQVAVNSGSVSGFASGDYVTVYYNDPARAGGGVTYLGTATVIGQTGDTHIVGQVSIPDAGTADVTGSGPAPPGYSKDTRAE